MGRIKKMLKMMAATAVVSAYLTLSACTPNPKQYFTPSNMENIKCEISPSKHDKEGFRYECPLEEDRLTLVDEGWGGLDEVVIDIHNKQTALLPGDPGFSNWDYAFQKRIENDMTPYNSALEKAKEAAFKGAGFARMDRLINNLYSHKGHLLPDSAVKKHEQEIHRLWADNIVGPLHDEESDGGQAVSNIRISPNSYAKLILTEEGFLAPSHIKEGNRCYPITPDQIITLNNILTATKFKTLVVGEYAAGCE